MVHINKFMKIFVRISLILLIYTFFTSHLFAQGDFKASPFKPIEDKGRDGINDEIRKEVDGLKNSNYFETFQVYKAVREGDSSICSSKDSKIKAEDLLRLRYLGEGRCNRLKDTMFNNFCNALSKNDCKTMQSDDERNVCTAILNKDFALYDTSTMSLSKTRKSVDMRGDPDIVFSLFWGFRNYNYMACQRFLDDKKLPLSKSISCRIIFLKEEDKILKDIAFFNISKKKNNASICNMIKIKQIKDACLNPKIKSFDDIW